ncbi:MAG: DUF3293 domain-containing protein [Rhodanobacteraceae bacterium]|nr:DUF3293 domain-containing protein [Rhodanobacteraceae bacterium]
MDATELLALYHASHYLVRLPGGRGRATLRIGEPIPQPLAEWLAGETFGFFITAYNPHSVAQPAGANRRTQKQLLDTVRACGARVLPGVGRIPGQRWREPSLFVAGLSLSEVDALAEHHGQNAIVLVQAHGIAELRCYAGC